MVYLQFASTNRLWFSFLGCSKPIALHAMLNQIFWHPLQVEIVSIKSDDTNSETSMVHISFHVMSFRAADIGKLQGPDAKKEMGEKSRDLLIEMN